MKIDVFDFDDEVLILAMEIFLKKVRENINNIYTIVASYS
jgi:hypothetical protein